MEDRNIYQDIAERTQGDIYIGVAVILNKNRPKRFNSVGFLSFDSRSFMH